MLKIGLLLAEIWPKTSQKADLGFNFLKFAGGGPPNPLQWDCDSAFTHAIAFLWDVVGGLLSYLVI